MTSISLKPAFSGKDKEPNTICLDDELTNGNKKLSCHFLQPGKIE
ncbi:MAG: hypothetical protein QOG51_2011 [Verrucomicrobiota bacterium]